MSKKQISLILIIVLVVGLIPQNIVEIHASNRSISEEGVGMIRSFEGFRSTAYKAVVSEKYYTIGYGHYGADVYPGMTVTREQAEQMLRSDIQKYEGYVNNFLNSHSISVNQSQYDALVSFTYNLGNVWVSTPTFQLKTYLINGINNYSDEQITTAFTNWCRDGAGNVLSGLVTRRQKEASYFLRERNGSSEVSAPQIHAWISDDEMGGVPENYKLGKMYYLCYEVLDSSTGNRFKSTNSSYSINETIYGPDGNVANTCDYENSNNNWIGYSTYTAGTYKGVITISGDFEGSVEVSYTLDDVKPQIRAWVSRDKMGEEIESSEKGDMVYLCYEMRDKNSGKKLNERIDSDYTVTETIYKPDGSVVHTYTYENSDYNWIGHKVSETGAYKCSVTVSGTWNGSDHTEVVVISPTTEPVKTTKPTIVPTVKPTAVPTRKPQATMLPTTEPTAVPTKVPATAEPTNTVKPTIVPLKTVFPTNVPVPAPTEKPVFTTEPTSIPLNENEESDLVDIEGDEWENDLENVLEEGDLFEVKGVTYEVTDASEENLTVEYIGYASNKVKTAVIPGKVTYENVDYKVTGIAKNAFKNNKKLTSVTIGGNVTYIGAYAFYGNSKLKTVKIISKKIKFIQKKAFFGVSKKVTVKVPASVKSKYKKMLKNAGLGKR